MVCLAKESETTLKGIKDSTRHFLLEMPPSSARRAYGALSEGAVGRMPTEGVIGLIGRFLKQSSRRRCKGFRRKI